MKKMRQFLSILLSAGMMVSLMPQSAFAEEITTDETEPAVVAESAVSEETESEDETEVPGDETEDPIAVEPEEENASEIEAPEAEDITVMSEDVQDADSEYSSKKITLKKTSGEGTKPADGTTKDQPFPSGTAGSRNFRIPAMVTLSDGTVVAATDARWDTTADGYGLDTIVSYSTDEGANWNYTFANYLGDNGNKFSNSSTAFIDPALATDGQTVWMLVDLFPGGKYIANLNQGTGFDGNGHLLLSADNNKTYEYYVGDYDESGFANVYSVDDGKPVSGITVDRYFYLYQNGEKVSNAFYSDSTLKVTQTSYLYLTSSSDGGKTWSAPTMLNSQVKNASEGFYGVGPGKGLVTSTGRIIFPCYTYPGTDGNTSVIYSDDNGLTWTRSADIRETTSEATLTEADGRLYMFTRHGGYYVSEDNGTTWSEQKSVGINYTTSCQLNAITYSEKIDGKTAVLLSAPTSKRTNGKIFVGLVQDDGSINWAYTYDVNSGTYQYSVLSELKDGRVGLLYENGEASLNYTALNISDIAKNAVIGTAETDDEDSEDNTGDNAGNKNPSKAPENSTASKEQPVTLYVGETKTITDSTGDYESSYTGEGLKASVAKVSVNGTTEPGSNTETFEKASSITSGNSYLISDGNENYLTLNSNGSLTNSKDKASATKWTITYYSNYSSYSIVATVNGTAYYLLLNRSGYSYNYTYTLSVDTGFYYNSLWYYNSNNGFYNYSYNAYYLRTNNTTWQAATGNTRRGMPYVYETKTTQPVNKTDITITGISEGTTGVQVGDTYYNITVTAAPDYVKPETTPFSGSGASKITKLTTTVGTSYDLNVSGSNVVWQSADPSIATVDRNGLVTGIGVGDTEILATVNGTTYRMPVSVMAGPTGSSKRLTNFYISEVSNTTVYYSINCDTKLNTVQEGELIYIQTDKTAAHAVDFFGDPDNAHALTQMGATNSAGDYFILHTGDHKTMDTGKTGFYAGNYNGTNGAGINQRSIFGDSAVQSMLATAIAAQCDGGMGFTRNKDGGDINSTLIFVSERLPEVDKKIYRVNNQDYSENTALKLGDTITFAITVTQHATRFGINYVDSAVLTDTMDGGRTAAFQGTSSTTKNILTDLSRNNVTVKPTGNDQAQKQATYTYYVDYTLKESDLDTTLTNTVKLEYKYKSYFSSGSFSDTADAKATLSIPTFAPKDIVVDFGLPVAITDYSAADAHGKYNLASGTASYGTVSVANNVVTYKPNTVLPAVDTVTLTNTAGGTYSFKVYPATTVYYEEGFAKYGSTWDVTGSGSWTGTRTTDGYSRTQAVDYADQKDANNYNYDAAYTGNIGSSNGTTADTAAVKDSLTFTFTGTGVDLFATGKTDGGKVLVKVTDANGNTEKLYSVQVNKNGTYGELVSGDAYNTPITSISGLTHGVHTITVYVTGASFIFDGFRVYNTINATETSTGEDAAAFAAYQKDLEENPDYFELRNRVLKALDVNSVIGNSKYASDIAKTLAQVYTTGEDSNKMGSALVLSTVNGYTKAEVQNLLDNGPKNELYLVNGQSLVFTLNTNRQVEIGLRALGGSASYTLNGSAKTVNSSVDMFYDLKAKNSSTKTFTLTVTSGVLSVTDLKVSDFVEGEEIFGTLTEADLESALVTLGFENEQKDTDPVVENPFKDVKATDYFYDAVLWASENGITSGVSADEFGPKNNVTRGQVVTFLWKAAGSPEPSIEKNPFSDVKASSPFYKAILWAYENNITSGVSATRFGIKETCTRGQIVTFLWKYAGSPEASIENPFSDVKANSPFYKAVLWAYENGITAGSNGKFNLKSSCTRAQTVTFLHSYIKTLQ